MQKRAGLEEKIPEFISTLDVLNLLEAKKVWSMETLLWCLLLLKEARLMHSCHLAPPPLRNIKDSGETLTTHFELTETLFAKADVEPVQEVYLWLGVSCCAPRLIKWNVQHHHRHSSRQSFHCQFPTPRSYMLALECQCWVFFFFLSSSHTLFFFFFFDIPRTTGKHDAVVSTRRGAKTALRQAANCHDKLGERKDGPALPPGANHDDRGKHCQAVQPRRQAQEGG